MTMPVILSNGVDCSAGRSTIHLGWRTLRNECVEEHPYCAACGWEHPKNKGLDGHHIIPRHIFPALALLKSNVIILCRKRGCHLQIGHFGNYTRYWNENVEEILQDRGKILMLNAREFKEGDLWRVKLHA